MKRFTAVLAGLALWGCSGGNPDPNAFVPEPSALRKDLQFTYFGAVPTVKGDATGQIEETREHVNFFMDMQFGGEQFTIDSILYMKKPTMLGVQYFMYDAQNKPKPTGEAELVAYLGRLQAAGALKYVTDAYPIDEPDLLNTPAKDIQSVNASVRRAFEGYGLKPRLSVIYSAKFTWNGAEFYDDIGFDNYSAGSGIFYNGDFARLTAAANKPGQKLWLVVGGASPWNQNPEAFINYANGDAKIRGIIAFVYFDSISPEQMYGLGIRNNGQRKTYCNAGSKVTRQTANC